MYKAKVCWEKQTSETFTDHRYHRTHRWTFENGNEIEASSSPAIVPVPFSDPAMLDPEEAFVASLASCHMLFFLHIAAGKGYIIEHYEDWAEGKLSKNKAGTTAFSQVSLQPKVTFSGESQPTPAQLEAMHQTAHAHCFIANSVKADIQINSL